MPAFTICQISDMHITFELDKTIDRIDVIANFENVLKEVVKISPDLVVISGDLCFSKSDKSVYRYVKDRLDSCGLPYTIIAGNHDRSNPLAKTFGYETTEKGDLYYTKEVGDYLLIFADSSTHRISSDQLERIKQNLKGPFKPVLFIHHPPAISSVAFMDGKYPLKNMGMLQSVLALYGGNISVFCGHYHNDREFQKGNLSIYLTPSTYFQISSETSHLKVASSIPGWRNIILSDTIETEVRYLNLL